jgi:hypothetical protein
MVELNHKFGFIDRSGIETISPRYDQVWNTNKDGAEVKYKGKWMYVDYNGNPRF